MASRMPTTTRFRVLLLHHRNSGEATDGFMCIPAGSEPRRSPPFFFFFIFDIFFTGRAPAYRVVCETARGSQPFSSFSTPLPAVATDS